MDSTLFFWLLPAAFLLLVAFRLLKKPPKIDDSGVSINGESQENKRKSVRSVIISFTAFLLVLAVVAVFVPHEGYLDFLRSNSNNRKKITCPTKLCADDFVEMVDKDIDDRTGVFHSKGLEYSDEIENAIIFIEDVQRNWGGSFVETLMDNKYLEHGHIILNDPDFTGYIINKKSTYEQFFEYLIDTGAIELNHKKYKPFLKFENYDLPILKYKNCLFLRKGFTRKNHGFLFYIYSFNHLELKDSTVYDE